MVNRNDLKFSRYENLVQTTMQAQPKKIGNKEVCFKKDNLNDNFTSQNLLEVFVLVSSVELNLLLLVGLN